MYTVADVLAARDFEDTIGFSAYPWDLPDPKRPSHQPMHEKRVGLPRGVTPIPYRVMVPRPVTNLICPGRAISVERDVLGPLREMAPCYAMGHAAGLASVQAAKGTPFKDIDVAALRRHLAAQGAIVEDTEPVRS